MTKHTPYERIDDSERFDGKTRISHEVRYRIASAFIEQDDSILDAGCGTGYGSKFFPTARYFGVDKNPDPNSDPNAITRFDFEDPDDYTLRGLYFDVFVGLEIIEHLNAEGVKHFVDVALNRTRKWIIISTPIVPNSNPFHKQQFTEDDILKLFESSEWEHHQTLYQSQERYGIFIFKHI